MGDLPPSLPAVERLANEVDVVLIQISRVFRDPALYNSKALGQTRSLVHRYIPQANRKFHEALDEIELDILKAKSVLERDLSILQTRRAERERLAGASRLREASKSPTQAPPKEPSPPREPINPFSPKIPSPPADPENEDIAMADLSQAPAAPLQPQPTTSPPEPSKQQQPSPASGTSPHRPATITIPPPSTTTSAPPPQPQPPSPLASAPLVTPTTANLRDAPTFESMFNDLNDDDDPSATDDANGMDFDFSLSNDDVLNVGDAANSFSLDLGGSGEGAASEDINSLMPGLENIVNDGVGGEGADFSMLDLGGSGSQTGEGHQQAKGGQNTNLATGYEVAVTTGEALEDGLLAGIGNDVPLESNFDNMYFGAGDGLEVDETMGDLADLDEWFNTDGA